MNNESRRNSDSANNLRHSQRKQSVKQAITFSPEVRTRVIDQSISVIDGTHLCVEGKLPLVFD